MRSHDYSAMQGSPLAASFNGTEVEVACRLSPLLRKRLD